MRVGEGVEVGRPYGPGLPGFVPKLVLLYGVSRREKYVAPATLATTSTTTESCLTPFDVRTSLYDAREGNLSRIW